MRSGPVIHVDGPVDGLPGLFKVQFAVIEQPAVLQRIVHSFRQGVMKRVARLRHADEDVSGLQQPGVLA